MTTQGRATTSKVGATKPMTLARAVPPAYPARLGLMQGNHASDKGTVRLQQIPMYEGRGLEAPKMNVTIHPKGSQR